MKVLYPIFVMLSLCLSLSLLRAAEDGDLEIYARVYRVQANDSLLAITDPYQFSLRVGTPLSVLHAGLPNVMLPFFNNREAPVTIVYTEPLPNGLTDQLAGGTLRANMLEVYPPQQQSALVIVLYVPLVIYVDDVIHLHYSATRCKNRHVSKRPKRAE